MITLIEKQKAAKRSKKVTLGNSGPDHFPHVPVTIYLLGTLGAGETVKVEVPDGSDGRQDLYVGGNQVTLTATDKAKTIYGPLEFWVHKTITAADVGVGISKVRGIK